jgi:serine protease
MGDKLSAQTCAIVRRMRLLLCALALSAAAYASVIGGSAELNPVRTHPHQDAGVPDASVQQIIVKLRAGAPAGSVQVETVSAQDRIANLAARSGLTMRNSWQIFDRMHVMQVEPASAGDAAAVTLARLRADSDVEYAVPDERRYIHAVPNDPLYAAGGQWYEQSDAATPAAVNAQGAWDLTTGDPNLVIADLDTGVRFDHPDLLAVANNGRLLPGYDFVSNAAVANDGDGRDADASDPGDWIDSNDIATSQFKSCAVQSSSWHGTRTAGILGALTNNLRGVAGMTWQGKILPVRVLGKCGGYDSDIIAGMMWAAGVPVAGVAANAHPARIINMSLGASGACPQSYQDVMTQLTALGVVIVVSAGNEGGPVDSPGNCAGAAAIAGIRHAGTKVGFSSLGPEVAVSAPAGNCVNTTGTCVYSIQTTTNAGTAGPVPGDDAYTGNQITTNELPTGANLGTSFSAPIVSTAAPAQGRIAAVSADLAGRDNSAARVSCSYGLVGSAGPGVRLYVGREDLRCRYGQCPGGGEGRLEADCGGVPPELGERRPVSFVECAGQRCGQWPYDQHVSVDQRREANSRRSKRDERCGNGDCAVLWVCDGPTGGH